MFKLNMKWKLNLKVTTSFGASEQRETMPTKKEKFDVI